MDILEHLQNTYVPMTTKVNKNGEAEKVPLSTVFFGGNQLTEERARNVQLARSDLSRKIEGPLLAGYHSNGPFYSYRLKPGWS